MNHNLSLQTLKNEIYVIYRMPLTCFKDFWNEIYLKCIML